MHNFATDVDGRAEGFKGNLHNVDGTHDTGAETAWFEQQHPLLAGGSLCGTVIGSGIEDSCGHMDKYTNGGVETIGEKWR